MLDTYLAIVSHPLFFTFIALCGAVYLLLSLTSLSTEKIANPAAWLRQHYVGAILLAVGGLLVGALCFYLVEIALNVPLLVDRLTVEINTSKTDKQPENLRNLAYAIATLIAVLAGSATVFFSSLRVWMNERNTRATEQGLITDRINKAVEGLGAEKTVKRQRHDQDGNPTYEKDAKGSSDYSKPVFVETSEPNLEVRIGSIFALERIARENPDFHVQVMEILCAYVRLNSPVIGAAKLSFDKRDTSKTAHHNDETSGQCPSLRIDIQTALDALGRRSETNILTKEAFANFKVRLNGCNLQRAEISGNWDHADFSDCALELACFSDARFVQTDFRRSRLSKLTLVKCNFENAKIERAELHSTNLEAEQILSLLSPSDYGHWGPMIKNCELNVDGVPIPDALREVQSSKIRGMIFRSSRQFEALCDDPRYGYGLQTCNTLSKCALRQHRLSDKTRDHGCFDDLFADTSVTNWPTSAPDHWLEEALSDDEFEEKFFIWRNS
ncbi:pentapeptide repeat-containing protein [Phaeobacter italicus]|uniref:pentapeptide repeat-containing protein n=1 Tax=Phaeobacter italicus TaxID=481446 RepID=UPI00232C4689|nr:pentapeptide repeat-containing protein [Phaeobacter italicus]